ncbi:MAG TPA: prolyl oligopeptidase family serine peptidase, partial [Bacteroidales bacterium]|nr:prolyl oligopeptidase family serine peptidase [Bacteroidales bacterium]
MTAKFSKTGITAILIILTAMGSCKNTSRIEYPESKKTDYADTLFGTAVPDPYRWLEDDMSEETAEWVKEQNMVTFGYLEGIPYRAEIQERLTNMWNYEKFSLPHREGEYIYFSRNDGLQNQYVVYRQKGEGEPELFLDPNKFSADGTTSLGETGFSRDGSRMAYSISEGGSDWRKIITIDAVSREIIGDTLRDIKFSGISWKGNEGFYYSSYDRPSGSELSAMTDHHKLYYHRAGTPQSEDVIVFGADLKRRYVSGYVTDDGRYLVISASVSTTGNELYIMDLSVKNPVLKVVVGNFDNNHYVVDNDGTKLFIFTDMNAPNGKVVSVDAGNPSADNWKDFIPETENVLSVSTGSGYFFANYLKDAISYVKQIDRNGNTVREVTLPGLGSANGFSGKKDDNLLYYVFANYTTPASIFSFDPSTGDTKVYKQPVVAFNSGDYVSEQVFYNSKDGTRIPMIITHRKGIELDGKNPALLYGYGGFGISETPEFSIAAAVWLDLGGIYAVPNIRGGGEYGETWHIAGTK